MKVTINNMDLSQIADSGQCFRWKALKEGSYEVIAFDRYLKIEQKGSDFFLDCSKEEWKDIWFSYFDMDTDYESIGRRIEESDDAYLMQAYQHGSGIRILKQDLWETIVSFIISQNNNIKRIKGSIEAICDKASLPLMGETCSERYRFPKPGEIDREFFNDKGLGLGYRDTYLADMYDYAVCHPDFPYSLRAMTEDEAIKELRSFKGIGNKVANCICLFGLHHIDAFPVDTHIKQILDLYYPEGFDFERYKGFAGIIQQYMFNYKLNHTKVEGIRSMEQSV